MDEGAWNDGDWDLLVERISRGDCTPFLGAGACLPTLPTGDELARLWAGRYDYPFAGDPHLPEVMQYASIETGDPTVVKQRLIEGFDDCGEPDYSNKVEPHSLLAGLPVNVYLTTNYVDYLTRALELANRRPVTGICPWYRGAEHDPETRLPDGYQPRIEEPLVYHLHGNRREPRSLVLTETDYVEFLVTLGHDFGGDERRVVPIQIFQALTRHPLLLIGYSLRDWSFRMLFHGVVAAVADVMRRRHVSVQLAPHPDTDDEDARRRTMSYLARHYGELNIRVFWGSAEAFCTELARRLDVGT